jgi:hypothetical protein
MLTVLEIKHFDVFGNVIWENYNLPNMVHDEGEAFYLGVLYNSAVTPLPSNYYCGLDNRTSIANEDTLGNLYQEPTQFGYARQAVSSVNGFTIAKNAADVWQATTNVVTFIASGGGWGSVKNLFLATTSNNSGKLISTVLLNGSHFLNDGEKITLRMGLTLRDATGATFPS